MCIRDRHTVVRIKPADEAVMGPGRGNVGRSGHSGAVSSGGAGRDRRRRSAMLRGSQSTACRPKNPNTPMSSQCMNRDA